MLDALICYASYMKRFTNHAENWGSLVDVKYWEENKDCSKYNNKKIFIGSVTDPYQPCELKYKRTRALLEQLLGHNVKITICTKSDLILRDLDLIKNFPDVIVAWSINTLDEIFRRDMDHSISIERKLSAMKAFHDAGVLTSCFIAPIFPVITNVKEIILMVKNICNAMWLENLNLYSNNKSKVLNYIYKKYRELYPLYYSIYIKNEHSYWKQLDTELKNFATVENIKYTYGNVVNENFCPNNSSVIVNYFFHKKLKKH